MSISDEFHVYDTTLRDGAQQEGLALSVADKIAIAQHLDDLGVGEDGEVTRYWWQRLEDDEGMLTDQALDREDWGLRPLTREDFYTAWDDPGWSLTA
jgi:hypothetical protein